MPAIELQGLGRLRDQVRNLPRQLRFAAAGALNDVAFIAARQAVPAQMARDFVAPTPYVLRSPWYRKATAEQLEAAVGVDSAGRGGYGAAQLSSGAVRGGKSTDPANVLRAEVLGGRRKLKRAEVAFQRIGILPAGYAMVPGVAAPRDGYGNVPGPFIVRLLAYFEAFGEQGYRANMTAKGRRRLAQRGNPRVGPPRRFAHIGGVEYFVSYGRLRTNPNSDAVPHLKPGIWQRSGTHGSDIKPVFLFVPVPSYRVRLQLREAVGTVVRSELPRQFRQRFVNAMRTVR